MTDEKAVPVSVSLDGETLDDGIVREGDEFANWLRQVAHNYEAAWTKLTDDPDAA